MEASPPTMSRELKIGWGQCLEALRAKGFDPTRHGNADDPSDWFDIAAAAQRFVELECDPLDDDAEFVTDELVALGILTEALKSLKPVRIAIAGMALGIGKQQLAANSVGLFDLAALKKIDHERAVDRGKASVRARAPIARAWRKEALADFLAARKNNSTLKAESFAMSTRNTYGKTDKKPGGMRPETVAKAINRQLTHSRRKRT